MVMFRNSHFRTMQRLLRTMSTYTPERASQLKQAYQVIAEQVNEASPRPVNLVAVSKLKPASDIQALYDAGVRHFGENYPNELVEKAEALPKDIKWHFIGALQLGNVNTLVKKIPNLYAIETVDSLKKAKKADSLRLGLDKIEIYLQYNTSGEEQKLGFSLVEEVVECVEWLQQEAKNLKLAGLMTIGLFAESKLGEENADFAALVAVKKSIDEKFGTDLQLSMGMSHDFVQAIKQGSTNVRVGSLIFGERPKRN